MRLLLAEEGYRSRFRFDHPVVPNTTEVPERPARAPGNDRVVYLGHVSVARGAHELVDLGRLLQPYGIRLEVIGGADPSVRPLLREAAQEGALQWYGYVPNDRALRMCAGAMAGVSLLHDEPNYRHSMPTKIVEYMAHGLPVITTAGPVATSLVDERPEGPAGAVVPFGDAFAAAQAVLRLRRDPQLRAEYARTGHTIAQTSFHWPVQARAFVKRLESWVDEAAGRAVRVPRQRRKGRRAPTGTALASE